MKRKTIGIIVVLLVLALTSYIGWNLRDLPQKRLLDCAEDIVFEDVDSAKRLLSQIDTIRLREPSRMLYDLMRALAHEEQWQLRYADTASCLSFTNSTSYIFTKENQWKTKEPSVWSFKRTTTYKRADDKTLLSDSTLLRVYHYYERASLGGTADNRDDLRRFGRICYAMSHKNNERAPLLDSDKLLYLAIHCAEASEDHALAFRAYRLLGQSAEKVPQLLCATRALEQYRQSPYGGRWLLTLINDYGRAVLHCHPFDLTHFPSVERMAAVVASNQASSMVETAICDTVFQCLDTLQALPAPKFMSCTFMSSGNIDENDTAYTSLSEVGVATVIYEEARQTFDENDEYRRRKPDFEEEWERVISDFSTSQDTYLSAGYEMKAASLQRRLMTAAIVILLLCLLLLVLLFHSWRIKGRQRRETERAAHQREAEQLAERLRQKDAMIAMLRGHIMDKSEILDMLEPTAGKRTVINARNWREIELTLDTADGNFVSRLRAEHPLFTEEDIRLCMLTRLRLSNTALSAIYVISVSAVQHRKQKLKKEGFGVTDPTVSLDQIIADY